MSLYKYVIVGGGMTADAAVRGIREIDDKGSIALFSMESDPPYDRPPLSKGLWKGRPVEDISRNTKDLGVDLYLARQVVAIDPPNKSITDDRGTIYPFDKLLLATGGTPRRLPTGGEHVIYFRTLADYRRLSELANQREHFAVIGGGFIGAEVAAALAMTGKKVTMILHGDIGARVYPAGLAHFVADYFREKGIDVRTAEDVVALEERGTQTAIKLRNTQTQQQTELMVDAVVAGLGIEPNVALAQAAGFATDNGIVVDRNLRVAPDIFAAGDVASFYNPALDRRLRIEHEDNANTMGQAAGRAMAGELAEYNHLPFFYSDLFELSYEAVGDLDARLETIADWKEPLREGVVYYMKDRRVRGVLLWNVWNQVDAARRLIAEPGPFAPLDLKDRLPEKK
jgi:3-phenylpropionate/trans-cinnamate dioxygenase ferredoxin reductase component